MTENFIASSAVEQESAMAAQSISDLEKLKHIENPNSCQIQIEQITSFAVPAQLYKPNFQSSNNSSNISTYLNYIEPNGHSCFLIWNFIH